MNQTLVKPCRGCRSWEGCLGKSWYSMSEIVYCRQQVLFILDNILDHQDGRYVTVLDNWPAEEKDTGYDNTPIQHGVRAEAPYARFRQITADVISRLERTGKDGRLLLLEVKTDRLWSEYSQEARDALNYVNGWRVKRLGYQAWVRQRRYRIKNLNGRHKSSII